MLVYAWIKHKAHPDAARQDAMQQGDVCYIYPIDADQGKLTHRTYFPVVVDLGIPCGERFSIGKDGNPNWDCVHCEYNDPELCEARKYVCAEWGAGTAFDPPRPIKKRRYKINLDDALTSNIKTVILKREKTEEEKKSVEFFANNNPIQKRTITDKTAMVKDPVDGLERN